MEVLTKPEKDKLKNIEIIFGRFGDKVDSVLGNLGNGIEVALNRVGKAIEGSPFRSLAEGVMNVQKPELVAYMYDSMPYMEMLGIDIEFSLSGPHRYVFDDDFNRGKIVVDTGMMHRDHYFQILSQKVGPVGTSILLLSHEIGSAIYHNYCEKNKKSDPYNSWGLNERNTAYAKIYRTAIADILALMLIKRFYSNEENFKLFCAGLIEYRQDGLDNREMGFEFTLTPRVIEKFMEIENELDYGHLHKMVMIAQGITQLEMNSFILSRLSHSRTLPVIDLEAIFVHFAANPKNINFGVNEDKMLDFINNKMLKNADGFLGDLPMGALKYWKDKEQIFDSAPSRKIKFYR